MVRTRRYSLCSSWIYSSGSFSCFSIYNYNFLFLKANTGPDKHSHHVTISFCRKFSYAQFFEQASSEFIQLLTDESKRLRGSLPPHLFDMCGMANIVYPNEDSLNNRFVFIHFLAPLNI